MNLCHVHVCVAATCALLRSFSSWVQLSAPHYFRPQPPELPTYLGPARGLRPARPTYLPRPPARSALTYLYQPEPEPSQPMPSERKPTDAKACHGDGFVCDVVYDITCVHAREHCPLFGAANILLPLAPPRDHADHEPPDHADHADHATGGLGGWPPMEKRSCRSRVTLAAVRSRRNRALESGAHGLSGAPK